MCDYDDFLWKTSKIAPNISLLPQMLPSFLYFDEHPWLILEKKHNMRMNWPCKCSIMTHNCSFWLLVMGILWNNENLGVFGETKSLGTFWSFPRKYFYSGKLQIQWDFWKVARSSIRLSFISFSYLIKLWLFQVNAFPITVMFGMCSVFLILASFLQNKFMIAAEKSKPGKVTPL